MAPRVLWLERVFENGFAPALYPAFLERLRGTPARLEESLAAVPADVLVRRDGPEGDGWSIQENVGHLLDLEYLPAARIEDFLAGAETLTPWLGNDDTDAAGYNGRPLAEILTAFRAARTELLARLDALVEEDFARESLHPRVKTRMRMIDLLFFQAEHDDHHLARIHELKRHFGVA
ncbi:MAG: DinB family protein [Planctomycetota bacterium]